MIYKNFSYQIAKKFDVWYCRDRRLLVYLGKNQKGLYVWVWVGTMMVRDLELKYIKSKNPTVCHSIDEDFVKQSLDTHIEYLFKDCNLNGLEVPETNNNGNDLYNGLVLGYKGTPNVECFIGNFRHPILDKLERLFTSSEVRNKPKKDKLKVGYVYIKNTKGHQEHYLYLGKRTVYIESEYATKQGVREVNLFMFCNPTNFNEVSLVPLNRRLRRELQSRVQSGYDGNFSINYLASELKELCFGCRINVDSSATWVLRPNGYICSQSGEILSL